MPERALYLTPETPYPCQGGGALRAASLLEYLAQRYRTDVIVFGEPGTEPAGRFPGGLVENVHVLELPRNARHLPGKLVRNAGRLVRHVPPLVDRFAGFGSRVAGAVDGRHYELAIIEHFWCAPYWRQLAPVSRRTVLDLHNIESALHFRCGQGERWPTSAAHRIFHRACLELEKKWYPCFSALLAASESDAALVREISPEARVHVYPNTIPKVGLPLRTPEEAVVFSGNLEYHPNIAAVRFFRRKIWPRLRERFPKLVWRLVGKNPQAVRAYTEGDPRILLSGTVADAVWEIAGAKVAVVPVLFGSGTRLKIIEAWAAGRAVVSTTAGAEGLPARHGENVLLADDPAEFADAVASLLDSPDLRHKIGTAGRGLYEKEFTWDAAWTHLRPLSL